MSYVAWWYICTEASIKWSSSGQCSRPFVVLRYINDVTDICHDTVSIKLFADDIKIYMEIENNSQTVIFQEYINVVSDWANKWQLKLPFLSFASVIA